MKSNEEAQSEAPSKPSSVDEILYDLARKVQQDKPLELDAAKAKINRLITEARIDELESAVTLGSGTSYSVVHKLSQHEYLTKEERLTELSNNLSKGENNG